MRRTVTLPFGARILFATGLAVSSLACNSSPETETPDTELMPGVYRFDGISADLPMDDLAPFRSMVGDASLVGLGESIHATRGYSQMKFRLFKYMVSELGFRVIAFENPWIEADLVADYVNRCEGDLETIIDDGLFSIWGNRSVEEMLEWMCEWNRENPDDRVSFFGFDTQQAWADAQFIRDALRAELPDEAEPWIATLSECHGADYADRASYVDANVRFTWMEEGTPERCRAATNAIAERFEEAVGGEAAAWVALSAMSLAHDTLVWYHFQRSDTDDPVEAAQHNLRAHEARDLAMANLLDGIWTLRHPGQRVAIWAHNTHLGHRHDEVFGDYEEMVMMGTQLRRRHGDDYEAFALVGYDVSINWPRVGVGPLDPPPAEAVESVLHETGESHLLVDFARMADDPAALFDPRERTLLNGESMVPLDQYRGAVFLDVVEGMDALFW